MEEWRNRRKEKSVMETWRYVTHEEHQINKVPLKKRQLYIEEGQKYNNCQRFKAERRK